MDYELTRSRRRSISLHLADNGVLKVRAPFLMPDDAINQFVVAKSDWVERQFKRLTKRSQKFEYHNGASISYLGREYVIRMGEQRGFDVVLTDALHLPDLTARQAKILIHDWLMRRAKDHLSERLFYFADQMQIKYHKLSISKARTRWGSCSHNGNIRLNWRLICASPQIIDYVVVHELAHIKQHNHSRVFWAIVKSTLPNHNESRRSLKDLGQLIAM